MTIKGLYWDLISYEDNRRTGKNSWLGGMLPLLLFFSPAHTYSDIYTLLMRGSHWIVQPEGGWKGWINVSRWMKLNSNIFDIQRNFNEIYKDRHSLRPSAFVHCERNRIALLLLYLYLPAIHYSRCSRQLVVDCRISTTKEIQTHTSCNNFLAPTHHHHPPSSCMPDLHLKSIIITTLNLSVWRQRWLRIRSMYGRLYWWLWQAVPCVHFTFHLKWIRDCFICTTKWNCDLAPKNLRLFSLSAVSEAAQ